VARPVAFSQIRTARDHRIGVGEAASGFSGEPAEVRTGAHFGHPQPDSNGVRQRAGRVAKRLAYTLTNLLRFSMLPRVRSRLVWVSMQFDQLKRREFVTLLGGAAIAGSLQARAQQTDRVRRLGVLMGYGERDPEAKALLLAFTRTLSELGWTEGRNLRMDIRWAPGRTDLMRTFAKELVSLQPSALPRRSSTPPEGCCNRPARRAARI
jgi:hypothetical protein